MRARARVCARVCVCAGCGRGAGAVSLFAQLNAGGVRVRSAGGGYGIICARALRGGQRRFFSHILISKSSPSNQPFSRSHIRPGTSFNFRVLNISDMR